MKKLMVATALAWVMGAWASAFAAPIPSRCKALQAALAKAEGALCDSERAESTLECHVHLVTRVAKCADAVLAECIADAKAKDRTCVKAANRDYKACLKARMEEPCR